MAQTEEREPEGSSTHKNTTVKGHEQLVKTKQEKKSLFCKPVTETESNAWPPLIDML